MRPTLSQRVILLTDQLIDLGFFLVTPLCFSIHPLPKCIHTLLHLFHHLHLQLYLSTLVLLHISQAHLASLAAIRVMPCLLLSFHINFPCRLPSRLTILFKPTHNLRPGEDKPYLFHEVYPNRMQCMRHLCEFDIQSNEIVEQLLSQVVRMEQLLQFQHLLDLSVTQGGLLTPTHPITIIRSLQHRILSPTTPSYICLIGHTIINFGVFYEEGPLHTHAHCPHRRQSRSGGFQESRQGMRRHARIYPDCPEHAYPRRPGFQGHLPYRYLCGHYSLWIHRFDSLWTWSCLLNVISRCLTTIRSKQAYTSRHYHIHSDKQEWRYQMLKPDYFLENIRRIVRLATLVNEYVLICCTSSVSKGQKHHFLILISIKHLKHGLIQRNRMSRLQIDAQKKLLSPRKKVISQQKKLVNHMYDKIDMKENICSSKQESTRFTCKVDGISHEKSGIYQDNSSQNMSRKHPQSKQKKQIASALQLNSQNKEIMHTMQSLTKDEILTLDRPYQSQTFKQALLVLYLLEVNQWVIDTVDRNRTYSCHYIHFLIPYLLVLLQVKTIHNDHHHAYLDKIYTFVLRKLNQPTLKSQLKSADPHMYLSFFLRARKAERLQVLTMLRTFMIEQKESMMKVCPYYYNFFVMVCNKETIFGDSKQPLLPYTIKQYQIKKYPSYTKKDIRKELSLLQKALVKEYHSPNIC